MGSKLTITCLPIEDILMSGAFGGEAKAGLMNKPIIVEENKGAIIFLFMIAIKNVGWATLFCPPVADDGYCRVGKKSVAHPTVLLVRSNFWC